MTSDHPDKRSVHPRTKLILTIALFAVAATVVAHSLLRDARHAEADSGAKVDVHCTACDEQFSMPYEEYRRLSPLGTDVSGPIACPRCGAADSVARVQVNMPGADEESETTDAVQEEKPAFFDVD